MDIGIAGENEFKDYILEEVRGRLINLPEVKEIKVNVVEGYL